MEVTALYEGQRTPKSLKFGVIWIVCQNGPVSADWLARDFGVLENWCVLRRELPNPESPKSDISES